MMVENYGLIFLSVDIDNLFSFCDGGERLVDDLDGFEGLGGGVELAQSAVDQDQTRHRLLLFSEAFVTAGYHFAHGCEIVHSGNGLDDEFAIIRFFHHAIFPNDHGCDRLRSLNMGNVEALDALWEFRERQRILKGFLNGAGIWLQHLETLIVRLLSVGAGEVDKFAFFSALRDSDVDA